MRSVGKWLLVLLTASVLSLSGCVFKRKKPPVPTQGQAPTIPAPQPETVPAPEPAPTETTVPPPPAETQPEKKEEAATKPKPKKHVAKKPAAPASPAPAPQTQASAQPSPPKPGKLVIQEGGAEHSGTLAAGMSLEESSHQKQTTEQLLASTEANLNSIKRQLSTDEQAMVGQIRDYMAQSRKATADADTVRARNLALKAHLLSDELVKH